LESPAPQSFFSDRSAHAALVVQEQPQDVDPFAALDALEELAGPATVQYCSVEQMQTDARNERIRESQRKAAKRKPKSDESPVSVVTQPAIPAQAPAPAPSRAPAPAPSRAPTPAPSQAPAPAPSRVPAHVAPPLPFAGPPQQLQSAQPLPPALPSQAPPQAPAPQVTETAPTRLIVEDQLIVAPFDEPEVPPLPPVHQEAPKVKSQHVPPPVPPPVALPANHGAVSRQAEPDSWDSDDEFSSRPPQSAAIQPAPVVAMSADDDWDSDDGDCAAPQKPLPRSPPAKDNVRPVAQTAPAFAPPVQESGWDSDEEPVQRQQTRHAPAPAHVNHVQQAGWDDSGDEDNTVVHRQPPQADAWDDACGAPMRDACGAPARGGNAFVAAKPGKVAAPAPPRGGSDLDDLMGELDMATAEPVTLDGMVPDFQCTQCDHQVMRISNFIWTDAVDYMFCRNFYPDTKKLRRNLVPRKGCSAFCCQCSWKSADTAAALTDVAENLKWKVLG